MEVVQRCGPKEKTFLCWNFEIVIFWYGVRAYYLKVVKWGTWGQKQNANLYHQRLQSARGRARVARKPCSTVGTAQNCVPNTAGSSLGFAYFLGCTAPFELRSPNVDIEKWWELEKS